MPDAAPAAHATEPAATVDTPPASAAATPPAAPPKPAPPAATPPESDTDWKAEAEKWKALSRKHEGQAKANDAKVTAETERVNAILKAAGIETAEADPVKALEESRKGNETLSTENRSLKVQLAVSDAAATHKADKALLVPVLVHSGKLAKLDPASDTFDADVDALVKAEVAANPKLLAAAAFPDLRQGNQGGGAAASQDPNAWLRQMAGRG